MTIERGGARRILLTGGRAPATLELARLLQAAGHLVFVAESARYYVCRVSRAVERCFPVPPPRTETAAFLSAIERIVAEQRIDLLLPTCEEIFYVARGRERLLAICNVVAPDLETLRELHHKADFIDLATSHGLPTPRTERIDSAARLRAAAADDDSAFAVGGLVLKPAYSRFGARVVRLPGSMSVSSRRDALDRLADVRVDAAAPWLGQQLVRGRELSTYSVACEGALVAHADYWNDRRFAGGACVDFRPARHEAARAWVERFVRALRFSGQIAFDFIEDAETGVPLPIECNPRATSGVHLFEAADRLDRAFLEPARLAEQGVLIEPRPDAHVALKLPMALTLPAALRRPGSSLRGWMRSLRDGRDAIYRADDPAPAAEQFRVLTAAIRQSVTRRIPLSETTTYDIEWNGER
ncbi:ATP-grasp domain-containing protein [Paenibacillus sp. TRM 82003]|nr:ATP-grasp domain-containing protein [Paenibacillus sp. TRM 82003]